MVKACCDFLHHADTFIQEKSACSLEPTRSDERGSEGWRGGSAPREVVGVPYMRPRHQVSVSLASYRGLR